MTSFFEKDSNATDQVYAVFENFIKKISTIPIYDMEALSYCIDAYYKNPNSMNGIVNKINRNGKQNH